MEANAYTVQKLARQYWITRLASAGDQSVAEALHVDSTPLGSLARTILHDCGYGAHSAAADSFADRFLGILRHRPTAVITIPASKIDRWIADL
jgi:hypothetical protein